MLKFNNFLADNLINENNFIQGQNKSYTYINDELKEETVLGIKYNNPETFYLAVNRLLNTGNNKLAVFSNNKQYNWNFTSEIERDILRGSQVGVLFERIKDIKKKVLKRISGDVLWLGPIDRDFELITNQERINKITFVEITSVTKSILERRLKISGLNVKTEVILFSDLLRGPPKEFNYCVAFDTMHYFINGDKFDKILQLADKQIVSGFKQQLKNRFKYMRIIKPKTINLQKTTSLIEGEDKEVSNQRYVLGITNSHFEVNEIVFHDFKFSNAEQIGINEQLMTFDERILAFYYKFYLL